MSSWSRRTNQVWAMGSWSARGLFPRFPGHWKFPPLATEFAEYGIFNQSLRDGWQAEQPDRWLRFGNLGSPPPLYSKSGRGTEACNDEQGRYQVRWIRTGQWWAHLTIRPCQAITTIQSITPLECPGQREFNFQVFDAGDYTPLWSTNLLREHLEGSLSQRQHAQGRELRLQQGVLLCCFPP